MASSQHVSTRLIYVTPTEEDDDRANRDDNVTTEKTDSEYHKVVFEYDLGEIEDTSIRVEQDEPMLHKVKLHYQLSATSSENADSGISLADSKREEDTSPNYTIPDVVDKIDTPKSRISIGVTRRSDDDVRRITSRSRSRRSCSLPDILDIDRYDCCPEGPRDLRISENDSFSSSGSLSNILSVGTKTPERKYSLSTNLRVAEPLCGREHIHNPCYVCFKDNEIYCDVCLSVHNFHCKEEVRFIPDIPSDVKVRMCRETERDLRCTRERLYNIKSENESNFTYLKETRQVYLKSVMKFKNTVIDILDKLEKEAMLEMDIVFNAQSKRLQENIAHLETQLSTIDEYLDKVGNLDEVNENYMTVVDIQDAIKTVNCYADDIILTHKNTNSVEFKFEPASELIDLLSSFETVWNFRSTETLNCTSPAPCSCDRPFQYRTPVKHKEFSALSRWHFDREKCCITGCEFLPNGSILLTDNNNKKVKMFDRKYRYVSAQSLHSSPWDIAVIDAEKSVVTVPDRKRLQFVSTHKNLALKNHVTLSANCWGVSYDNGHLYISCWSPELSEVLVTDLLGTPTRRFRTVDELPLHTPWFVRAKDDVIYISDWGTYVLSCVTSTGTTIQKYRSPNLVGPLGLAFDCASNIYVCGRDSNNIHQLSPDGNLLQIILSERDGIKQPLGVRYNKADNRLLVTSWMSDKVQVFKFQ